MSQVRAIVIAGFVMLLGAPFAASAERIFCESRDYHRNFCPTGGNISNARLVVQQSQAACIQGRTWGYDRASRGFAVGAEDYAPRSAGLARLALNRQ